jgi:hypothetical protein
MAVNATAAPSPAARKIRRLGIAVAIVVALYSAGWFFVASKFESFLNGFVNGTGPGGSGVQCDGLTTGGYPFRIGFTCDKTGIEDGSTGDRLAAGAFRATALVYNPFAGIVELDGPANLALNDGSTVAAEWKQLRSSFHASLSGLRSLSLASQMPAIRINSTAFYEPFDMKAKAGEFHLRDNNGDLDLAVLARDFEWNDIGGNAILPKLSTSAELTLIGKATLLEGRPFNPRPMTGELKSFKIETPDGLYGEMNGPFTIDDEGYISGTFRTTFEKIDLWDQKLKAIFPGAESTISGLAALLKGLAKGEDKVTVNLEVDRGNISLSMLPLGRIPPL